MVAYQEFSRHCTKIFCILGLRFSELDRNFFFWPTILQVVSLVVLITKASFTSHLFMPFVQLHDWTNCDTYLEDQGQYLLSEQSCAGCITSCDYDRLMCLTGPRIRLGAEAFICSGFILAYPRCWNLLPASCSQSMCSTFSVLSSQNPHMISFAHLFEVIIYREITSKQACEGP